ncbi:transglutaminaseTgpA domain-containing protein [Halomicrobium salinisoli]|uniref:transglutaminase family protein n=1 Tax=Halomicrobium salinisoli TaxID=2878391 RepID=UPI001CEFF071|nr:transglutaminase domain-containing protein [Halomicrobium salinisoli]
MSDGVRGSSDNHRLPAVDWVRALALLAVAAMLGTALQVMYHFIDVTGLPSQFLVLVALSFVFATVLARTVRPAVAVAVGAVLLAAGVWWYLSRLSGPVLWGVLFGDTLGLLTGRSLLQIANIRAWVLGVTPGPVVVTWYFAVRRQYAIAVAVAGGTLGFFVLSGDADVVTTLSGVVAGAVAVGLGDFDRRGEPVVSAETIAVVAAAMIVVPSVVSVVPTSAADVQVAGEIGPDASLEASLVNTDDDLSVQGPITLSPEVRFTVEADEGRYWRVASYDRYTGQDWVRTGGTDPYQGNLDPPPGPARRVDQTVRPETELGVAPAAWKPVQVDGLDGARVAEDGSIAPGGTVGSGDVYRVRSAVPDPAPAQLREVGTDYPEGIEEQYTQLPESTPDRVGVRTERLTRDADNPYETALTIEQWLENNRNYSLDVRRPNGDVADAFLFEMDAGYCTYYATTMATMLRSQDIPARFVVGYTSGQRVEEDRWVVRGLNAHAWVEAYFPEYGWVRFDPTPGGGRDAARQERLDEARASNESDVDTGGSEQVTEEWTATDGGSGTEQTPDGEASPTRSGPAPDVDPSTPPGGVITGDLDPDAPSGDGGGGDGGGPAFPSPTRQELALAAVALVGLAVGLRRSGAVGTAYRAVWLRYQPRTDDPAQDVERAFQRLLYHLGRDHYRSRLPTETVDEFLDAVDADERARRVAEIRERCRYAGEADPADADEAVRLVNELVR